MPLNIERVRTLSGWTYPFMLTLLENLMKKEAKARIIINRLLEHSGWHFFDDENGLANIALEVNDNIMILCFNCLHGRRFPAGCRSKA